MAISDVTVDLTVQGLTTTGEPVEYELVSEQRFEPNATEYVGIAEVCTMYFDAPPEQIPFLEDLIVVCTEAIVPHIIDNDGTMLMMRIYNAKGEWYNSKWKVEVIIHASPFPWAVVIPLFLVALIVIGFTLTAWAVKDMSWGELVAFGGIGFLLVLGIILVASAGRKKVKGV